MKEETKDKLKDVAKDGAQDMADWLKEEANASTGIMRWVYGIGFIILTGICALLASSCEHVTPVKLTAEQVQAAHALYHAASGEPCIFVVENVKK